MNEAMIDTRTGTTATGHDPGRQEAPDLDAVKGRQQAMWATGDYGEIGIRLQIVGESLCEAADVQAGERVIDVAAGNGNASIAAARRFAVVTSTDYVPALLEQGRARADADRLPITFQVADVEHLPFSEATFDVLLSTFGAMFAPNQPRVAAELLRVVRPGGRIGMANWTPEGFLGRLFGVMRRFVTPPPGVSSPMLWGTEPHLVALFGPRASDIRTTRRMYAFRYRSPEHFVEVFRTYYGPIHTAFAGLDAAARQSLNAALIELLQRENTSGRETLVIPSEYLEVVITK